MSYIVRSVKGPDHFLKPLRIEEHDLRNAPDTMARPPFLAGMFGSRGAGKTTLMIQLMRWYDSVKAFDEVIVFSPTHNKDPKYRALQKSGMHAKLQLEEKFSHQKLKETLDRQEKSVMAYEKYKDATEAFRKYKRDKMSTYKLTEEELLALYEYDFTDPKATTRFENGRPSMLMVFDDQIGNKDVYRGDMSGPVATFTLKHRHYNVSLIYMAQIYSYGIPKGIRENLSQAYFFANKSDKLKLKIAEDMCGSYLKPEQFVDMWSYSTEGEDHGVFSIIFNANSPEERFRKNFDQLLVPGHHKGSTKGSDGDTEMSESDEDAPSRGKGQKRKRALLLSEDKEVNKPKNVRLH